MRVAHVLLLHVGGVLALQRAGDQRGVELLQLRLDLVDAVEQEGEDELSDVRLRISKVTKSKTF